MPLTGVELYQRQCIGICEDKEIDCLENDVELHLHFNRQWSYFLNDSRRKYLGLGFARMIGLDGLIFIPVALPTIVKYLKNDEYGDYPQWQKEIYSIKLMSQSWHPTFRRLWLYYTQIAQTKRVRFGVRIISQAEPTMLLVPAAAVQNDTWLQLRTRSTQIDQKLREFWVFIQVSEGGCVAIMNAESDNFVVGADEYHSNIVLRMKKLSFTLSWLHSTFGVEAERIINETLSKLPESQLWFVSGGEIRNKAYPDLVLVHLSESKQGYFFQESFRRVYLDSRNSFKQQLRQWNFRGHEMYNDLSEEPTHLKRTVIHLPQSSLKRDISQLLPQREPTVEDLRRAARKAMQSQKPGCLRMSIQILHLCKNDSLKTNDLIHVNGDMAVYHLLMRTLDDVKTSLQYCEKALHLQPSNPLLLLYLKCQILLEMRQWDAFIKFVESTPSLRESVYAEDLENATQMIKEIESQWSEVVPTNQDYQTEREQTDRIIAESPLNYLFREGYMSLQHEKNQYFPFLSVAHQRLLPGPIDCMRYEILQHKEIPHNYVRCYHGPGGKYIRHIIRDGLKSGEEGAEVMFSQSNTSQVYLSPSFWCSFSYYSPSFEMNGSVFRVTFECFVDRSTVKVQDDTYGVAPKNWFSGPVDKVHERIGIMECGAATMRLIRKLIDEPSSVELWNDLKIPGQCKGIEWMTEGKNVIVTGLIVKKVEQHHIVDKKQEKNRVELGEILQG